MRLSFVAVTTAEQFRDLLAVRNECRDGMTHDTREISLNDQRAFRSKCWFWTGTTWYEPYVLYDADWPIGYGLLHWDGQKYWMTIGVALGYRGKGLSHLLTSFITAMGEREGKEVWLDCAANAFVRSVYEKAGYVEEQVNPVDGLVIMKHA